MKPTLFLGCLALLMAAAAAAYAQHPLVTEPEALAFQQQDQAISVQVMRNGQPVQINRVRGYQFLVGKNTYEHMITVEAQDGKLRVKPTEQLEVGSYVLAVDTDAGRVILDVYAPLSAMDDSLEARAQRAGVTTEEMKQILGLSTADPREGVRLGLPPVYYEGQTLVLSMQPNPERQYTWTVNGKTVKEGPGQNELVYTFKEPGEYVIGYTERENGNVVAAAKSVTTVMPLPPVAVELPAHTPFVARAPEGFRNYAWTNNGRTIGNGRQVTYLLGEPGIYEIECLSQDPLAGPYDHFSKTRYRITAK